MAGIFYMMVLYPSITAEMCVYMFDCYWMYAKKFLVLSVQLKFYFFLHFTDEN